LRKVKKALVILLLFSFFISSLFADSLLTVNEQIQNLNGQWELYLEKSPEETFKLVDTFIPADYKVLVPNEWNKQLLLSGKKAPEAYGCYRYLCTNLNPTIEYAFHTKESPGTSCALYVNRKLIGQAGDPFAMLSKDYKQKAKHYGPSHSKSQPLYFEFTPDENGHAEIIVFVSNYYYRKGGLWDSIYIGPSAAVWRYNNLTLIFYCLVIGSLLFTTLLNLFQFALNKKRTEYFYLALASFACASRIATAGYCSLSIFFPALTAEIKIKIELLSMWLIPIAILQLIFLIYPVNKKSLLSKRFDEKYLRYALNLITFITGLLTLILPAWYSNRFVPFLRVLMIIYVVYVLAYSIFNLIKRKRYSLYNFLSFFIIAAGGIIDIIHQSSKKIIPVPTLPFFILAFVVIQIIMLAAIQNDINKKTVKGSEDLRQLNDAYFRFVPKEFLKLLNKDSITKTKLGDYSNIEMCIMFSKIDISLSGKELSLEEHFSHFNNYLKIVSPVIRKYDGFVSKFLSGGFMALFPNSEKDAIRSALEIIDLTESYNEGHEEIITPRMGIHFGKMIVGTIGEESRLDDTVISDTVNTASRIQSVCDNLNKSLIISEAVKNRLLEDFLSTLKLDSLDAIFVKGKEKPLKLFEVSRKKQTARREENR